MVLSNEVGAYELLHQHNLTGSPHSAPHGSAAGLLRFKPPPPVGSDEYSSHFERQLSKAEKEAALVASRKLKEKLAATKPTEEVEVEKVESGEGPQKPGDSGIEETL
ncbi:hypothetical protein LY78DRAFT_672549 [Colletotrichum sublineola]|nr:hypothetical protein LY78DRAFT_672549 [Colletotrichum sublineola]